MIRLKPLLETQLIREALPFSKAKKYANIKQNPAIKARVSDIITKLSKQPGAKLSRRQDRVAIPFQHKFDVNAVLQDNHSNNLINFSNALIDLRRDINHFIKNQLDDNTKPFPTFDGHEQIVLGQLPDQYGRAVKMSKYIKMLLSYQVKRKLDHLSIIIKTNPDTGERGVRKTNGEWNTIDTIKQSMKKDAQTKFDQLMQEYNAIPEVKRYRQNKDKSYYLVFSKHSYDVAGMSTDRGWSSCMNLYGGINSYYIQHDIEEGTMVVYLVTEDDLNITNPTARIAIKPFISTEDSDDVYYQAERRVYGTSPDTFLSTVDQLLDSIQTDKGGLFRLVDTLYCDSNNEVVKFSDPNIAEKINRLIDNREQATTVDEVKYILYHAMNMDYIFYLDKKFHYDDADKLYVSAATENFQAPNGLGYCPIAIGKCHRFSITNPALDAYQSFPIQANIVSITNPLDTFDGLNTMINQELVIHAREQFSTSGLGYSGTIIDFKGLRGGFNKISMYADTQPGFFQINSFHGIPSTVDYLKIFNSKSINFKMTIDELVSQLKPIGLKSFHGLQLINEKGLTTAPHSKLYNSINDKIEDMEDESDSSPLNARGRFLKWLFSELPTVEYIWLMDSTEVRRSFYF